MLYLITHIGVEQLLDTSKQVVFFKYNFGYEYGLITPLTNDPSNEHVRPSDPFATFPRSRTKKANAIPGAVESTVHHSSYKPKKISDSHFSKWTPKKRKVVFENTVDVQSFSPDSRYANVVSSKSGCELPGYLHENLLARITFFD